MAGIQTQIKEEITGKEGQLFFPEDFIHLGSPEAIHMALSRLSKEKELTRLAKGIYLRPKIHPSHGPIMLSIEEIAAAIAKRDKIIIRPTGSYALNKLGLSTQIPMKVVFLTDGHDRLIKIGRGTLRLKQTSPKKLAAKNELVFLAIQALQVLGQQDPEREQINFEKLRYALRNVPPAEIRADARYAPQRLTRILYRLAGKLENND